jgi:hypothetical protein
LFRERDVMTGRRADDVGARGWAPVKPPVSGWARASLRLGVATVSAYACLRAAEILHYRDANHDPGATFEGGRLSTAFFLVWAWAVLPAVLVLVAGTVVACVDFPVRVVGCRRAVVGAVLAIVGPWLIAWSSAWFTGAPWH